MKIVKPMAVSFSFRTFLVVGKQELCVTSLVGFRLGAGVRRLVSDIVLWPIIGEVAGGVVDEGLPKTRGEVLVHGSCHAPGGVALPAAMVRVRVAAANPPPDSPPMVEKKLAVFGDRYWSGTASRGPTDDPVPSTSKATEPVPFTQMPLGWQRAFGGPRYAKNPLGRGTDRVDTGEGIWRVPLPNVEHPASLVTSSSQRPEPAGFGPLDLSWPQRRSLAGKYDSRWLQEDFPGFARDTDPAFFSTAQPDQRIEGYFRGDEQYVLENLHPAAPVLHGSLPGAAARVLVRRKGAQDVEDVRMTLDTLVFLPGEAIGVLVFRGTTPVVEDDASDVAFVLAACEDLDAPRPAEHYARSLERRLDKDQSPLLALNEDDLLPSFAAGGGLAELIGKIQDSSKERRDRAFEQAMARVREQLAGTKVDKADEILAKMEAEAKPPLVQRLERMPDPADPKDMAEYVAALDAFEAESQKRQEEMERSAREQLDRAMQKLNGQLDAVERHAPEKVRQAREEMKPKLDAVRRMLSGEPPPEDAPPTGDGPPKPQSGKIIDKLKQARQEPDPKLVQMLQDADVKMLEQYRGSAHYAPPARLLDEEGRRGVRRALLDRRSAGESLAELDFTRADLSGLNLVQADLRRALMEGADLSRTKVTQADLTGAVLAHTTLRETRFDGSLLERTNLGSALVEGASFAGTNLRGAILARSKLRSASFHGADLTGADWLEAELGAVDFEAALLGETTFLPIIKVELPRPGKRPAPPTPRDLTRCRFARAKLRKSNFLQSLLSGVDFTEADLELVTFLSVVAGGASFRGACMRKFHAVMGCSFEGACFEGADLSGAFLRGSNLRGASFVGARLDGADLSECDLTGANLSGVQAKEMLLIRADLTGASLQGSNLMEAMLQKSTLHGADLSKANLFAANLGQVRTDTATRVQGANLKRALMLPRRRTPT